MQVLTVYEHLDTELCLHLPHFTLKSTIVSLIEDINYQKNIWFDMYIKDQEFSHGEFINDWQDC